jgi:hypothetical protein
VKNFAPHYLQLAGRVESFMSAGDMQFEELAFEVFEFQMRWNEGYARFCDGKSFDDWKSIPAVPTAAFKDLDRPVTCFPIPDAERFFETSGTTGETRGRHYFLSTSLYERAIDLGFAATDLPLDLERFWLSGLGGHSSLAFMLEHLSGREAGVLPDGDAPMVLMGTALSFLHLFESGCKRLPEGSWALETGGYKGSGRDVSKGDLYAMFGEHLGIPPQRIVNEYGMTELSSQFYARGVDGLHEGGAWVRTVVRHPETGQEVEVGEPGYLSIYDLANIGSVMAIATQDIAVRHEGGAFELVGRDPAAIPRGCSRAADEFFSRK